MRCKFCGSQSLRSDQEHRNFSVGKAVAGAAIFGPVGTVGGFVGKDLRGYRCGACGAFMDAPMDLFTEHQIDNAISVAEAGRNAASFQYYQRQYPNIRANIPAKNNVKTEQIALPVSQSNEFDNDDGKKAAIKHIYRNLRWNPTCPVYVQTITICTSDSDDTLSLSAWNQSDATVRSAYFSIVIYDDTGDEIGKQQCVYQGLSVEPGNLLPTEKVFSMHTDLAYRVELFCEKVAFSDDSVWRAEKSADEIVLLDQPELTTDNFPRLKYARLHLSEVSNIETGSPIYLPVEEDSFWQCVCGQPVAKACNCPRCGANIEKLNRLFSQENLIKLQRDTVKATASKRAAATVKIYEEAENFKRETAYQEAVSLQEQNTEESLSQAAEQFDTISDYKDSAELAEQCRERIKTVKQNNKNRQTERRLERAYNTEEQKRIEQKHVLLKKRKIIFVSLLFIVAVVGMALAIILPNKSAYQNAEMLAKNGECFEAAIAFSKLGSFSNSRERSSKLWDEITNREIVSAGSDYTVGLLATGRAIATGNNKYGNCNVSEWDNLIAVSAGGIHAVGLKADGTLVTTGSNGRGQCNVTDWKNIVAVSAGGAHTVGLLSNGSVVATGYNYAGQCDVTDWDRIIAISAGEDHTVGLKSDGTVVAVGNNESGQCDISKWTDITFIYAHGNCTVGIKSDGTVVTTAYPNKVYDYQDIIAVAVSTSSVVNHTVGLRSDGSVVADGWNYDGQCEVSDWSGIVAIAAGGDHTVGLKSDGTVLAVGRNDVGQCNVGDWSGIKVQD